MVVVKKQKGESEDKLIARFKRVIFESGKLDVVREKDRFKSPSEKKKEKRQLIEHKKKLERKRNK